MIKKLLTTGLLFFTILSNAQIKALTEIGDEVILYKNNTWKYSNDSLNLTIKIIKNEKLFVKNEESTFLIKSSKTNAGIWISPQEWNFSKSKPEGPSDFDFNHKTLDIYGMLIVEKAEIPVESLVEIAYKNALEAAPDTEIIEKEFRNVNGINVIMMKMKGTMNGVNFVYFGYYYTSVEGAFQFVTYTTLNLFDDYEDDMLKLLNGFTEY
jgi:hypothetical protein